MNARIAAVVVVALLTMAGAGHTAVITVPGLYASGLASDGTPLEPGAQDLNYAVLYVGVNAQTVHQIGGHWLPNDSNSQWIWQTAAGTPTGVTRYFRTSFELDEAIDLDTLTITGNWAAAGIGLDILINGNSTNHKASGPTAWSAFNINTGFVPGTNTIDFVVQSMGSLGGFRVDAMVGTASTPAPGSTGLACMGIALLINRRRR